MGKMISISDVSELTGVTIKTLKIWDKEGKLKAKYKTPGGHRRYDLDEIEEFIGETSKQRNSKAFIYCRVSTKKQQESGNLQRQKERLIKYCDDRKYSVLGVYEEVASGLNDKRRQLIKMLKRLNEVDYIIVEYPDRLARFGYNYIIEFCKAFGVEIRPIEQNEKTEQNEEMVTDLISIVTCFSARLYGARGGRKVKKDIKKSFEELEKERGDSVENNN